MPLKHLSNLWRRLDMPLINSEINPVLKWSENCVLKSKALKDAETDADAAENAIDNPTKATFKITDTKL